ncbi:MAG: hypothetical protein WD335_01320 [Candidatus Paceibacterota bacterium]
MPSGLNSNAGFAALSIVLFIGGIIAASTVGYVGYQVLQEDQPTESMATTSDFYTEDRAATSSSSVLDFWKTYRNDEHGFSLRYPEIYGDFKDVDGWAHDSELESFQTQASGYPNFSVKIHDIDTFAAGADVGGTWPHYYISEEDRWIARSSNATSSPSTGDSVGYTASGHKVYFFETANIPSRKETYAIPVPDQNLMVELSFLYNTVQESSSYTTEDVDREKIFSSFDFYADISATSESDSWQTYRNGEYGFSFQYPEDWRVSTGESEGKDEVVVRVVNPEYAGASDTDIPAEQFLVRKKSPQDCQFGELTKIKGRNAFDTGWAESRFTGLPQRDICFDVADTGTSERDAEIKISLSGRNEASVNTMNRILNSFDFTAIPDIPLTLHDIDVQYTDKLLNNSEFTKEINVNTNTTNISVRKPIKFAVWNRVGTDDEPLAVINLLYEVKDSTPTGYEIILFDIDAGNNISNPTKIDSGYTAGSYSQNSESFSLNAIDTQGHFSINLEVRIPEIVAGSDQVRYIEKEFSYMNEDVVTVSSNED